MKSWLLLVDGGGKKSMKVKKNIAARKSSHQDPYRNSFPTIPYHFLYLTVLHFLFTFPCYHTCPKFFEIVYQ